MRDNDDDGPRHDSGSLADGLGETVGDDPFGDGGFGAGEVASDGTEVDAGDVADETPSSGPESGDDGIDVPDSSVGADGLDPSGLQAQSVSPLEGLGYILGEVREALFGDDGTGHAQGLLHDDPAVPQDIDPSDDPGVIDA